MSICVFIFAENLNCDLREQLEEENDFLLVVENLARNMTFPRGAIVPMQAQDGFAEFAEMVKSDKIVVSKFKVIILLIGRGDLWTSDKDFRLGVAASLQAIRVRNKNAIIMFCAIIPFPGDSPEVKRTSSYRHGYLSFLAGDASKLEFSKPGKHLINRGAAVPSFFNNFGLLTERGLDQVRRALEAKIRCAAVLTKYKELHSGSGESD